MSLNHILNDLKEHLLDLKEQGITNIEVDPALVKNLGVMSSAIRSGRVGMLPTDSSSTMLRAASDTPALPGKPRAEMPSASLYGPAAKKLKDIAGEIALCKNCRLAFKRTNTVPGQGNPQPEVMFVGEGPGEDEDLQGLAFVGRAGQLLTKMIEAMGFSREEVFIGNIVKCRPPDNRKPEPDEMEACIPFLKRQIAIIKPKVIVALGATSLSGLVSLPEGETITKVRGKWLKYEGIDLMPTFHPAYLLYSPAAKKEVWIDLQEVLKRLGRTPPKR